MQTTPTFHGHTGFHDDRLATEGLVAHNEGGESMVALKHEINTVIEAVVTDLHGLQLGAVCGSQSKRTLTFNINIVRSIVEEIVTKTKI